MDDWLTKFADTLANKIAPDAEGIRIIRTIIDHDGTELGRIERTPAGNVILSGHDALRALDEQDAARMESDRLLRSAVLVPKEPEPEPAPLPPKPLARPIEAPDVEVQRDGTVATRGYTRDRLKRSINR